MMQSGTSMVRLVVENGRCYNCRRCLAQTVCRPRAIVRIDRDEPPFVDVHRCLGCQKCVPECPFAAIQTA